MKNLKVIYGVILLSICGGIIVRMDWKTCKKQSGILNVYNKKLKKKMGNINHCNLDYILKWEGGLSKHKLDSASMNCVPDGSGYHTNRGVTWAVFRSVHGNSEESIQRFYAMTDEDWLSIYRIYWDGIKGDDIESDIIAEFWADFAWGSGVGGAARQLQYYLRSEGFLLVVDGIIGKKTLSALNGLIEAKGEQYVFDGCYIHRVQFLKGLKSFAAFGRGWLNRLEDFYDYAEKVLNG